MARKITFAARARRYLASAKGQQLSHRMPALVVFGVAAYNSYWHIVDVTLRYSHAQVESHIMPLSVDGMMLVAARYITHARTRLGRYASVFFFALGTFATLSANVMAADPNLAARLIAVWPAVALVGTAIMLHWGEMKPKVRPKAKATTTATSRDRLHVA
jgi:hypothetical protein